MAGKRREPSPHVRCADGATLSVQAGGYNYCEPQDWDGPYLSVEVWCLADAEGDWLDPPKSWAEYGGGDDPYARVPVALVREFIESHGGGEWPKEIPT